MGKFKDEHGQTRIGKFLKEKGPHILDIVGDVLPEKGALGIVKNLIEKDEVLTPEDKAEALDMVRLDLEAFKLEVDDRKDARSLYKSDDIAQKILAALFTIAYFAISYVLLRHFFADEAKLDDYELGFISTLFGAMSSKVNTIIDFFFGGSIK